ncbi:hypothetical protein Tco_0062710, partial [Tanacetum coccineum]
SKRRRAGKEPESTSTPKEKTPKSTGKSTEGSKSLCKSTGESTHVEDPMHTAKDLEEPAHQELPSADRDWNKTLPTDHGPVQPWLSNLAREEGPHESFDELMDTPLDFSAFMMNRLKVDTLTPKLLAGPTFELMKVITFDHFINNDLAYLSGCVSSRTYATSVTKTQAVDYGHIKWIEDLVPNTMWSEVPINYDKRALYGISHWRRKRQQFYGFAANRESAGDVYSKRRIIAVTKL